MSKVDTLLKLIAYQKQHPQARERIGRQVLSLVQEDFAVILLAPCFLYALSPLEIQFDESLTHLIDLIQNMSQLTVERY